MKLKNIIAAITMASFVCQAKPAANELPIQFPYLGIEFQDVVVVTADFDHPKPCPPKLTNLLTNTKFFSKDDQARILDVIERYKNVTTNTGPGGSVFTKWGVREIEDKQYPRKIPIAFFTYTNSATTVEVWTFFEGCTYVRTRDLNKNGFNINLFTTKNEPAVGELLLNYQEYSHGVLHGICVSFSDVRNLQKMRCSSYYRFQNGKIFGDFIGWERTDDNHHADILMEARFKKPFDILSHQIRPVDMAWAFENPINPKKNLDEFTRRSQKTMERVKELTEKESH